jgi:hypothetical protein
VLIWNVKVRYLLVRDTSTETAKYDYTGVFLSALCAVHCMLTPVVLVMLPTLGSSFRSPWVHGILLIFIVAVFFKTILPQYRLHRSKVTLWAGIAGLVTLTIAFGLELANPCGTSCTHHEHNNYAQYVSILGGCLLITAHIFNLRSCSCLRGRGVCSHAE